MAELVVADVVDTVTAAAAIAAAAAAAAADMLFDVDDEIRAFFDLDA